VAWDQNVSGGGSLLPSFEGTSTSGVTRVDIGGSQTSTYPLDWSVTSLRDSCVRSGDPATSISGLSITRSTQPDPDDSVYTLTGASNFSQLVMVGDEIRLTENGPGVARVLSVTNSSAIISSDIPGSIPSQLYFSRQTNDISEWFQGGFSSLRVFRAYNCRLSGTLNIRSGFNSLVDEENIALDLRRNMISGYQVGSLGKVFSGDSRKITVDLSGNNLPESSIRDIISEISLIDSTGRFSNCRIRVGLNKLDSSGSYVNYPQSEIFPVSILSGPDRVTSLFRDEVFNIYTQVTTTDEFGNESTTRVIVGTKTVPIPGELVGGVYYKTLTQKTQTIVENPSALQFKQLLGIRIDLGFTYVPPDTSPTVVSSEYLVTTTRNQSIIDAGYDPANLAS
jgi:hypothetical protein